MSKDQKPPFYGSVLHHMELYDSDFKSAMESTQSYYDKFKNRNERLLQQQNSQSNAAQIQLISHFSLLATLTLTVVGFLVSQTDQLLTQNQKYAVIGILALQITSLILGALDYLQTIAFHRDWAKVYQNIDNEVESKFNSGKLQRVSELGVIEASHTKKQVMQTKEWITQVMIATCVSGLLLLLALFIAYYFDVWGF